LAMVPPLRGGAPFCFIPNRPTFYVAQGRIDVPAFLTMRQVNGQITGESPEAWSHQRGDVPIDQIPFPREMDESDTAEARHDECSRDDVVSATCTHLSFRRTLHTCNCARQDERTGASPWPGVERR
jgi:hypothetical protein